jgi:hypothetical protein
VVPRIALVAVSGTPPAPPELPVPAARLPSALRGQELDPLVLVHGDEQSRVVVLPFGRDSRLPLAVLKLERSPGGGGEHGGEQAVLARIRALLDPGLRASVPEPLGMVDAGSVAGSVESFMPGTRLHSSWAGRPAALLREDLELVAGWLREFGRRARVELRRWDEGDAARRVDAPLAAYERAFAPTRDESRLFEAARRRALELTGLELPIVWQHGDLSSLNVFRYGRRIHVIDWEAAAPGLPLDDLLYFTTRWLYHVRDATIEESPRGRRAAASAFRELFLQPERRDPDLGAARAAIRGHVEALGIDGRFLPLLQLLPWVTRAVGRLARQETPGWSQGHVGPLGRARTAAHDPEEPRAGNRYVAQVGILAEAPELLFGAGSLLAR